MPLDKYQRKRRFEVTLEPSGHRPITVRRGKRLRYVIQKHRASTLHYDFRLEWNGVLLSWAIPKGPSLDPSVRRMATPTEDHPMDYADFEGIIPEGEYGGGTVMVWDNGTWLPRVADVDKALAEGEILFTLRGKKLKGSWVLVRMRRPLRGGTRPGWLLIKHRDDFASTDDVTITAPRSVLSKRTLAQIARDEGGNVGFAATGDPRGV
jgi:bifunctional non-homologous end joining protein LigD